MINAIIMFLGVASLVMLLIVSAAVGQDKPLQPHQFRFQQPPSLDIKPSYESNPCMK